MDHNDQFTRRALAVIALLALLMGCMVATMYNLQIVRGDERIDIAPLPDVFTNIPAEEYELLAPLSAKAFVVEDMRKMIYLERDRFTDCSQEVWDGYFFSEEPDGFFKGAHMDFNIIVPFSKKADEGEWKKSKLEKVKEYILRQL